MKNLLLTAFALMGCLTASAQWGADGVGIAIMPEGTSVYGNQTVMGADGTTWYYSYRPTVVEDEVVYRQTLQALDKDGNKKFPDEGLVVSDYENISWTEVNQYIYPNSDGSITMVARDLRNSSTEASQFTYTAYRISPDGEQLWGDDGVNIDEEMKANEVRCISFCELSDGSTVFVWQRDYGEQLYGPSCLEIQRVSKDGKCLYTLDDTRLCKTNGYYVYPYVVPSDNGSFILVYGYTSSYYLKAMKYNSDGTQAWDSAVDIYKGGWGSTPYLQTRMHVYPGPDDGVVIGFNADPTGDNVYYAYVSYIKKDGTPAFVDGDGNNYIKLSYEEYMAYPPHLAITDDYIYAVFSQFSYASQNWNQLSIQKVNMNGEILWGDNGVQVRSMEDLGGEKQCCGSENIALGKDGQIGCFYEYFYDYHNVQNIVSIRSTEDGSAVNPSTPELYWLSSKHYRESESLLRSTIDDAWIISWTDDAVSCSVDSETRNVFFTKMDFDGKEYGVDGIENVNEDENQNENLYNLAGQRISAPQDGQIYIKGGKKMLK